MYESEMPALIFPLFTEKSPFWSSLVKKFLCELVATAEVKELVFCSCASRKQHFISSVDRIVSCGPYLIALHSNKHSS